MSTNRGWKRSFSVIAVFVAVWLGLRYLFPFFLPFLLGLLLALFSEPGTKFFENRWRWRRSCAAAASVSLSLGLIAGFFWLLGSVLVSSAAHMARSARHITEGLHTLEEWALTLSARAPAGLAQPLEDSVRSLFDGGLLGRSTELAFDLAGRAAQQLPGLLVTAGTALLSSYMISVRLPRILAHPFWQTRLRPVFLRIRTLAHRWFKAQLRLSSVTFAIVLGGFFLLGVKQKLLLALFTAAVDAVPLLGTGAVLLPWSLVSLLSGEPVRTVGLLGIYVIALLVRSSLEPKLLGRQLGLDPLAALAALYAGYRIWGFWGMVLAPILTVAAKELCRGD